MKIYLEYVFIENLIIDFLSIYELSLIIKEKFKIKKIIIITIIVSLYTAYIQTLNLNIVLEKVQILLLINFYIYFSFKIKNIIKFIKAKMLYLLINVIYIGIIFFLTLILNLNVEYEIVKLIVYLMSYIILHLSINFMWKMWKSRIKKDDLTYIIKINDLKIKAFIDTGNFVKSKNRCLDVFFIDNSYFEKFKENNLLNEIEDVSLKTIDSKLNQKGYIVNNVEIYKDEIFISNIKRVVIVFSGENINLLNECKAIIGYETYVNEIRGVNL